MGALILVLSLVLFDEGASEQSQHFQGPATLQTKESHFFKKMLVFMKFFQKRS